MTFVTDLYELNNFIRKSNFRAKYHTLAYDDNDTFYSYDHVQIEDKYGEGIISKTIVHPNYNIEAGCVATLNWQGTNCVVSFNRLYIPSWDELKAFISYFKKLEKKHQCCGYFVIEIGFDGIPASFHVDESLQFIKKQCIEAYC